MEAEDFMYQFQRTARPGQRVLVQGWDDQGPWIAKVEDVSKNAFGEAIIALDMGNLKRPGSD